MGVCNEILSYSPNKYPYLDLAKEVALFIATIMFYK